jgi:hypothetical protein
MTVEGPSPEFQILRDVKDTLLVIQSNYFEDWKDLFKKKLEKSSEVSIQSKKFTMELLAQISPALKIRKKQVSRVFDLLLLLTINLTDHMMMTAYKGYLRRKTEKLSTAAFLTEIKKKHIEFMGEVEEIDYNQFKPSQQDRKLSLTI